MAQMNIRIDDTLKNQVEQLFGEIGLPVATAVNMFFKQCVRENRIPLDLSVDPFYSESNMNYLKNAIKEMEAGRKAEHELIEE